MENIFFLPEKFDIFVVDKLNSYAMVTDVSNMTFQLDRLNAFWDLWKGFDKSVQLGIYSKLLGVFHKEESPIPDEDVNNNLGKIESDIIGLMSKFKYEDYDMKRPSEQVVAQALMFVRRCPNDELLDKVSVFPCNNGTIILKWICDKFSVSLQLSSRNFSYAIVPKSGDLSNLQGNQSSLTDTGAIDSFFSDLKRVA